MLSPERALVIILWDDGPPSLRCTCMAGCRLVDHDAGRHEPWAVPDEDGILVGCTCGWELWSRTTPTPVNLRLAREQIGGRHLTDVNVPTPPRRDVLLAVGALAVMVCLTVVAVLLIWTW